MPGRKINICRKLPLTLFRASVANTDIGSLKSLHRFLLKCLHHMLAKFERNRMVQTIKNCEFFDQKKTVFFFQCSKNYGSPTRVTRLKVAHIDNHASWLSNFVRRTTDNWEQQLHL